MPCRMATMILIAGRKNKVKAIAIAGAIDLIVMSLWLWCLYHRSGIIAVDSIVIASLVLQHAWILWAVPLVCQNR